MPSKKPPSPFPLSADRVLAPTGRAHGVLPSAYSEATVLQRTP